MWTRYIAHGAFSSGSRTGKWLFDVPHAEADAVFACIEDAVAAREIPAAKRASPRLEALLGPGYTILLAYVADKDPGPVAEALARLRARGVLLPGRFKCDEATMLGRERVAYLSEDFEEFGPADPAWPRCGNLVRLDDGACLDLLLTRTDREGVPWGVGYEIDQGKGARAPDDAGLLSERRARRQNLARADLRGAVAVIDQPSWAPHRGGAPLP